MPSYIISSIDLTIGVSPTFGGLRGSWFCIGRPNGKNGSRGHIVSRGENKPSPGVGGTSTNCIPANEVNGSCKGFLVIVSARGDSSAGSSGKAWRTAGTGFISGAASFLNFPSLGGGAAARLNGTNPRPPVEEPNLWAPNPGDGGGLGNDELNPGEGGGLGKVMAGANPGDEGGKDISGGGNLGDASGNEKLMGANPGEAGGTDIDGIPLGDGGLRSEVPDENPESGCGGGLTIESRLNRPCFPGSFSSSFSVQEKLEGADEGPGEMGSPRLGVEFPRARVGLLSGATPLVEPSVGKGAVSGSLGETSMLLADSVIRCFVGLFPGRNLSPALGAFFLVTSFWKSCRQYISLMLGLIHLLLACAA